MSSLPTNTNAANTKPQFNAKNLMKNKELQHVSILFVCKTNSPFLILTYYFKDHLFHL